MRSGARCSEERRLPDPGGGVTLPARRGARDSEEPLVPCPGEAQLAAPRRKPSAMPRGRGPIPVRLGARCSEERRLPGPERWGCPDPVGWGAADSEEPSVPCPGETGLPTLRRVPVARFRWSGFARAPKSARSPAPEARRAVLRRAPSAVPRWVGALPQSKRGLTGRSVLGAVPPKRPMSLSRRGSAPGAPKSAACLAPSRCSARCSEERLLLHPGTERSRSSSEEVLRPCPGGT